MEVAPFRGLRYDLDKVGDAASVTAPPYDVISPREHGELIRRSDHNITRITLGADPGSETPYEARGALLRQWIEDGVLAREDDSCFYVYEVQYTVPGTERRARMLGFIGLGRLHPFEDGVILPHEQTFPKVVEDRKRLLAATNTHLESIFLLYSDPEGEIDAVLGSSVDGRPAIRVEAKPGEVHSLYPVNDARSAIRLTELMRDQRPIIADGHHRYTTSVLLSRETDAAGRRRPGSAWQMMTFTNLHSEGLSILATHRLLELEKGTAQEALSLLKERLEPCGEDDWDILVETRDGRQPLRFPDSLVSSRRGVAKTGYALLQDVIIGDWLRPLAGDSPRVSYFKEGTGEDAALREGEGDVLFRMRPVGRQEFQEVIEGGEVFPHKTTYFYPKLWSGLVLWELEDVDPLALK